MRIAENFRERAFSGPVAIMAKNSVAANLLMLILIGGGIFFALQAKQEVFPEFSTDRISITVPYPGATPEEVEQGILLSIEDEVRGIDGVKEVTSNGLESSGLVSVELLSSADDGKALQDVKNAVDSILSFPEEAERPVVSLVEVQNKVITVLVHGDVGETTLRAAAERVRDFYLQQEGITKVELDLARRLEIAIEVPEDQLRRHGLTLEGIARIVRSHAVELGGGQVRTEAGEILLRTDERRLFGEEFADVPVLSRPDGSTVLLGEIATIVDGFEDTDEKYGFNGSPAIAVDVYRVGSESPQGVAAVVYDKLEDAGAKLPPGIALSTWDDDSVIYQQRMNLLLKNMALGLILVLGILGLFLEPRLAFWVTLGIPISVFGAFLFFQFTGATINMISLFAFIVTLGIIVDDAVVVGENIYEKRRQGLSYLRAAIEGAREISGPVVFAVLTNIAAFTPMFFIPGESGKLFLQIPAVTVSVFIISLVESLFILPAHLSHGGKPGLFWTIVGYPRKVFGPIFDFVHYKLTPPIVGRACRNWGTTLACGVAILILAVGVQAGGHIPFTFMPRIDLDQVSAQATMAFGVPMDLAEDLQGRLIDAAREAEQEIGEGTIIQGILTRIGSPLPAGGPGAPGGAGATGAHLVGVQVELVPTDRRSISGTEFSNRWREKLGEVPGLETMSFSAEIGASGGAAIDFELSHPDRATLERAASEFAEVLREYDGVYEIDDGVNLGKPELRLELKPGARALEVSTAELARQVRHSFYGAEALRQQRGRNEVKVMVRRPESEREALQTVETMMVRTQDGGEVPLLEAVSIEEGRAYTQIRRREGRRILSVTADVDENVNNANVVVADLTGQDGSPSEINALVARHPGLTWRLEGQQADQQESLSALGRGMFLALFIIYALLAIPLKSYVQPFVIMLSIPFGVIGALIGHVLHGFGISLISLFGIIALSGVVVNDSLVLLVTANRLREQEGLRADEAIARAAVRRFRPIILTSLTTFFGLLPMIFETEVQARFLIPMALSIAYGLLFATFIILLVTPALYIMFDRIREWFTGAEIAPLPGGATEEGSASTAIPIPVASVPGPRDPAEGS